MKGKVYLVGAGPGDYKLITLKGLECIQKADMIVYDRLANDCLLAEAKPGCEFIYVGKASSDHTKTQDEINDIIAQEALKGKTVTRLKGGDPYVFGRGGEEGEYLLERGIQFEVVPGITSAIGGLCYAGIPITHRDFASSFHVITGHLKSEEKELDWKSLAALDGTLVFLMGMKNLDKITENLISEGKDKETPVAIINWATRPNQKVVTGTLETISEIVKKEGIKPPSLIAVGGVVSLRDKLNFFESGRLFGKNVLVTRSREQASKLVKELIGEGANPVEFPTIKINKIDPNPELMEEINKLSNYNYMVFTSVNGVKVFFETLFEKGMDVRSVSHAKFVTIGPATTEELSKYGIKADIVPEKYVAEYVVEEMQKVVKAEDRILVPRAKEARSLIIDSLSKIAKVKEVKIYETTKGEAKKEKIMDMLSNEEIHYITFTSSSTVKNFMSILGEENKSLLENTKLISIGPVTSETVKSFGLSLYKEADEYTISGIMDVLKSDN